MSLRCIMTPTLALTPRSLLLGADEEEAVNDADETSSSDPDTSDSNISDTDNGSDSSSSSLSPPSPELTEDLVWRALRAASEDVEHLHAARTMLLLRAWEEYVRRGPRVLARLLDAFFEEHVARHGTTWLGYYYRLLHPGYEG